MRAASIITFVCAAIGVFILFVGVGSANGAPQEAAAAALAVAVVVIPYVVASTLQRARIVKMLEKGD